MKRLELGVGGMSCAACSARVERALKGVGGVESASVNLAAERANIVYDENVTDEAALKKAVKDAGYNPFDLTENAKAEMAAKKGQRKAGHEAAAHIRGSIRHSAFLYCHGAYDKGA